MLPKEGVGDVSRYLPRSYLDSILTSNSAIAGGIRSASEPSDNNEAPRRKVHLEVTTLQGGSIKFTLSKIPAPGSGDAPTEVVCRSAVSFHTAARNCFITGMRINVPTVRPILFNVLMKEAHRWRLLGMLEEHPPTFTSSTDFDRFFNQLVVTQGKLTVDLFRNLPFTVESQRFWALEAVRQCQWLVVDHMPPQMERSFSAATALQWLNIPPSSLPYKRLFFHQSMLSETVPQFVENIITSLRA